MWFKEKLAQDGWIHAHGQRLITIVHLEPMANVSLKVRYEGFFSLCSLTNSTPMTPAPITTRWSGTFLRASAPVDDTTVSSSICNTHIGRDKSNFLSVKL